MTKVVNRLSDKIVERLVPRTTATACQGPQNGWFQFCRCDGPCDPPLGTCKQLWKWCDVCAGITSCSPCDYVMGSC